MSQPVPIPVAALLESWNAHDARRASAYCAPDYEGEDVAEPGVRKGPQGMQERMERYLRAFPDLHVAADETLVQGDRVALAWTARGTHRGVLLHIPVTGRSVTVRGISLVSLHAGQIRRTVCIWDVAGLLRQLGLLPELPPS